MTDVYSASLNAVVATGGAYTGGNQNYAVPNCVNAAGQTLVVDDRYTLRDGNRPQISVKCLTLGGGAGGAAATFQEV
ncbi:hypothetical protein JYG34_15600 [Pseudomonas entomophila]|uniref:hypothetical protein n=1 Tax=Pseudomonas entomophila TaxID=312306 RepID=UPI001BCC63D0|nr:hypothetical protein [Pseudomonas entomophila]QVM89456.1 hypothetical protein JYG34_15600 [Pseudomonas entomophila]